MNRNNFPIGIFDSGIGGLTVLSEMVRKLPREHFIYFADSAYAPYGEKTTEAILERCLYIARHLIDRGIKALVVACNTATSSAIKKLRASFSIPIVGMEPALKPAIEANLPGKILVLGTEFTIREEKYQNLLKRFSEKKSIISVACPGIVQIIETKAPDHITLDQKLAGLLGRFAKENISAVVLGCTHFVYLKQPIRIILGNHVKLFDGNRGTANQLKRVLSDKGLHADKKKPLADRSHQIVIDTSAKPGQFFSLVTDLMPKLIPDYNIFFERAE